MLLSVTGVHVTQVQTGFHSSTHVFKVVIPQSTSNVFTSVKGITVCLLQPPL